MTYVNQRIAEATRLVDDALDARSELPFVTVTELRLARDMLARALRSVMQLEERDKATVDISRSGIDGRIG